MSAAGPFPEHDAAGGSLESIQPLSQVENAVSIEVSDHAARRVGKFAPVGPHVFGHGLERAVSTADPDAEPERVRAVQVPQQNIRSPVSAEVSNKDRAVGA